MKKIISLLIMSIVMLTFSFAEAASYIEDIKTSTDGNQTKVKIYLSQATDFTEGKLVANKKIYFDFQNTIIRNKLNLNVNKNKIQTVRAAQNTVKPTYVSRVVFDMEDFVNYSVYVSKSKKIITITFNSAKVQSDINKEVKQETKEEIKEEVTVPEKVEVTSRGSIDREVKKDKKVIVIDAGHGGKDPGAVFSSVYEKSLNLDIAKRLRKLLEAKGYEVIMTRTTDVFLELADRANIANKNNADLFISIHNNSMPSGYSGVMTLYSARDEKQTFSSKNLADTIQENMLKSLGTKNIGARERDNLVVLNKTTMPAVIVEVGCMSDSAELKKLKKATFRQKAAQGIYNAIISLDF